jgi:hypothetical protein
MLGSSCPPAQHVASLPAVTLHLNSVVFTRAFFGTLDLTDFYLGTPLPAPQYIKIYVNSYPPAVLTRLGLDAFIKHDASGKPYVFFRIH